MIGIIVSGGISFLVVIFSTLIGVNFFKSRNIGQEIQEELNFHDHKKGTPTMGGIFIVFGTIAGYTLSHINFWTIGEGFKVELTSMNFNVMLLFGLSFLMALVGLIDDLLKVKAGRNLGFKPSQKITFQLLIGIISAYYFMVLDYDSNFYFFSGLGFDIGIGKWLIIIFFIIGITNSVNFTDGLDGLVAGSSAISFGGILIISFWIYRHPSYYSKFIGQDFLTVELSLLISAVAGACLGFLWWNTNPAKIIMGDVGSHFLGSLFPLILFALGADGLIFFFCFLFILEGVSVVIQIVSFKYRQKRVFKMAPIHHHFEMNNWAETTIIVRFWIINGIAVVIGLGLFYADYVLFGQ
tara:strand:+ start:4342 stop:5400 length:1059 start_codon:yes stop_codon:yes gene_type:complete